MRYVDGTFVIVENRDNVLIIDFIIIKILIMLNKLYKT